MGPYPASTERERIAALKRLYDGFGLRLFSIQLSASDGFAPDADVRRRWLDEVRDRLRLARQLGCAHIGMWPGGGLRGQTLEQALKALIASFREVGKMAGDLGLVAAFELEPVFVFNSEAHVRRILEGVGSPTLKTIYDPSHFDLMSGSKGRPHEMLARVGVKNVGYVHFTDTDGTRLGAGTSRHLACGDGHIDVDASLRTLRDGGYRGWIMVDEYDVPDPLDACLKCKRAFDAFGAR
jgi:sugar phosphate isomerase/epimerase